MSRLRVGVVGSGALGGITPAFTRSFRRPS